MKEKYVYIETIIILIVVNLVAFLIPTTLTINFWISYIFTIIAIGVSTYIRLKFTEKQLNMTSRFYKIPTLYVAWIFSTVQIISFIIFKFGEEIPTWLVILVSVLILVVSLLGFITLDSTVEYIENIDKEIKSKVQFLKILQADVEMLIERTENIECKEKLQELADKIRYSDPMSSEQLVDIEKAISDSIGTLKNMNDGMIVDRIPSVLLLLEERNKKCKILK